MKFILISLFVLAFGPAIASDTDQRFEENLIGKWSLDHANENLRVKATEEFKHDGTLHSHGKIYKGEKLVDEYDVISLWKVVQGHSSIEIISSTSTNLKPGTKIKNKIISIDDMKYIFLAKDGKKIILYKIK